MSLRYLSVPAYMKYTILLFVGLLISLGVIEKKSTKRDSKKYK